MTRRARDVGVNGSARWGRGRLTVVAAASSPAPARTKCSRRGVTSWRRWRRFSGRQLAGGDCAFVTRLSAARAPAPGHARRAESVCCLCRRRAGGDAIKRQRRCRARALPRARGTSKPHARVRPTPANLRAHRSQTTRSRQRTASSRPARTHRRSGYGRVTIAGQDRLTPPRATEPPTRREP